MSREINEQVVDSTGTSGSANAATIKLGGDRTKIDIWYDVANDNGDIVVEVSSDKSNWREVDRRASGNIDAAGETDWIYGDSTYTYARAYAGGAYADADINTIEISGGE